MAKPIQALLDLALTIGVMLLSAGLLHGLIKLFARRISDIRYFKSLVITLVGTLLYGYLGSLKYALPDWVCALAVYVVLVVIIVVYCFVPYRRAVIVALLFIGLAGGVKYGSAKGVDRLMPGRWTLEQQTRLARAQIARSSGGTNSLHIARILANFMKAVAEFLHPGEAERMQAEVGLGLVKLREMRQAGENYEDVVLANMTNESLTYVMPDFANSTGRLDLATVRAQLGLAGATGKVDLAEIAQALTEIRGLQQKSDVHYADADLRTSTSNLLAALSSPGGVRSARILGNVMGKMVIEFGAAAGAGGGASGDSAPTVLQATTALVSMAEALLGGTPGVTNMLPGLSLAHLPTLSDPRWAALIPTNIPSPQDGHAAESVIDIARAAELVIHELPRVEQDNILTPDDPRWAAKVATNSSSRALLQLILKQKSSNWQVPALTGDVTTVALADYILKEDPASPAEASTDGAAGPTDFPETAMAPEAGMASADSHAAHASAPAPARVGPELMPTPPELKVSGYVAGSRGKSYVLCNGELVRLGGEISIKTNGSTLTWRLETVEQKEAFWSRVATSNATPHAGRSDFR